MKQIAAHIGPAYSCAWHLELEHRIVSAGRDKMIKVEREREVSLTIQLYRFMTSKLLELKK